MKEAPLGEHYIIELWECNHDTLNDLLHIQSSLTEAANLAGATIIDERFHQFAPQGVSGVVVIAESHLSIHTWPELGYAALDLFTCKLDMSVNKALRHIERCFAPGHMDVKIIQRGIMQKLTTQRAAS